MKKTIIIPVILLMLPMGNPPMAQSSSLERCLLEAINTAPADMTVAELRETCMQKIQPARKEKPSAVEKRLAAEAEIEKTPWAITPHKPNYVLPISYNDRINTAPFEGIDGDINELQNAEVKFQISFKFPLARNLFNDRADLYFAYTNQSWWQLYAGELSSPFRETNHEPDIFFRIKNDWNLWGLRNSLIDVGYVHQSNGRSEPLSRSWDRLYAAFIFEKDDFAMSVKPWLIVGDTDDNPDIEDFMGYGELRAAYVWRRHTFSTLLRNNLSTSDNKGGIELAWSHPLSGVLRLYAQYYHGYGESLLDYNWKVNRFGIGFAVSDALQR